MSTLTALRDASPLPESPGTPVIEIDGKQVFRELSESGHPAVPVVEIGGDVAVPVGAFDPRFAAAAHGETLDARSLRSR